MDYIVWIIIEVVLAQLALAARSHPDVVDPELFIVVPKSPPDGVHIRELLLAARVANILGVDKLTRAIFNGRVADGLVKCLREIGGVQEFEEQALGVDSHCPVGKFSYRWTAVQLRIRREKSVLSKVNLSSALSLENVISGTRMLLGWSIIYF